MTTAEKGKPPAEKREPKGALHIKATTTDWAAIIALKHSWEREEGHVISVSDILRRCLRQCAIVAGVMPDDEPPEDGGAAAARAGCGHCQHLIGGEEFECPECGRRCGRDIAALAMVESDQLLIVQDDGTTVRASELPAKPLAKKGKKKKAG